MLSPCIFLNTFNGPFKLGAMDKKRFEVSATVRIPIVIFWAVTSCAQVGGYEPPCSEFPHNHAAVAS